MEGHWLKKLIIFTGSLVFTLLLFVSWNIYSIYTIPLLSNGSMIIQFKSNESAQQLVRTLKNKGLISSSFTLRSFIKLHGWSQVLKAGYYKIYQGDTAYQVLQKVVKGDVLKQSFTIIEGTTWQVINNDLANASYLQHKTEKLQKEIINYPHIEGLLLADTYQYDAGSNSDIIIKTAHTNLMEYLNTVWSKRDADLPYKSPYEMLISASIIEKETSVPEEKKLVSSVIVNRLKKNMRLQMDPTVIYGLGKQYKGNLTKSNLNKLTAYNTYKIRGLPPTPIAMVGKSSIDAAAHPNRTNFYYFVAKGDGTHLFSKKYHEQMKAVLKYQKKGNL